MIGEFNTDVLINYLIFSGFVFLTNMITFLVTRYVIEHHTWKYHLPKVMAANLSSRDKIIANQAVEIEELKDDKKALEVKLKTVQHSSNKKVKI